MKKILVTGGLGFIGSHTCVSLFENGYEPIVIDNLSNSLASVQGGIETLAKKPIRVFAGDIRDTELLDRIFNTFKIEGIIHFAALKAVNESILKPLDYFDNNINGLLNVIKSISLDEFIIFKIPPPVFKISEPSLIILISKLNFLSLRNCSIFSFK